jgi:hypothetical protein
MVIFSLARVRDKGEGQWSNRAQEDFMSFAHKFYADESSYASSAVQLHINPLARSNRPCVLLDAADPSRQPQDNLETT